MSQVVKQFLLMSEEEYCNCEVNENTLYFIYQPSNNLELFIGSQAVSNVERVKELRSDLSSGKFYVLVGDNGNPLSVYYKISDSDDPAPVCDLSLRQFMQDLTDGSQINIGGVDYRVISLDDKGNITEEDSSFVIGASGLKEVDCRSRWGKI